MPFFKPAKLTRKDIREKESMVRGRQEKTKNFPENILPNELILTNYQNIPNQNEIFNLIDNHTRENERGKTEKGENKIIFHFTEPKRAVSIGRQLSRAFKGSDLQITWSKVNKEVKVYLDFNNVRHSPSDN
ncbi:MAG: hypothetical protein WC752_01745 [Patescibacteria group bacterium]|jgi:hypothetical protein